MSSSDVVNQEFIIFAGELVIQTKRWNCEVKIKCLAIDKCPTPCTGNVDKCPTDAGRGPSGID